MLVGLDIGAVDAEDMEPCILRMGGVAAGAAQSGQIKRKLKSKHGIKRFSNNPLFG